jgi:thiamine biosynthesis lipoprotein
MQECSEEAKIGFHTFAIRAMNTHIELLLWADAVTAAAAEETAADWFRITEERFSRFRPDSELCALNRLAGERCLVSDSMLEVLQLAEAYRRKTDGIFDPLLLGQLERLGYDATFEAVKRREEYRVPRSEGNSAGQVPLDINPLMKSVRYPHQAKLDLGGIVKSWSVGRLAGYLQTRLGIRRGLVNAGGDLAAWGGAAATGDGTPPGNRSEQAGDLVRTGSETPTKGAEAVPDSGSPWLIGIENPWETALDIGVLALENGAAATSSTLGRRWTTDRGTMHHLIDPATGVSGDSEVVQCTVSGPDAVECEIWAKVICIAGLERGLALMRSRARSYEALLFTAERSVVFCGDAGSIGRRWRDLPIQTIESR